MTAEIAESPGAAPRPRLSESMMPVLVLAGVLALYCAARTVLLRMASGASVNCLALDSVAFTGAALLAHIRYGEVPAPLRPLVRGIAAVVLAQVIFDSTTLIYAPARISAGGDQAFFDYGAAIAVLAGAAALWRPSFALPLLFHYVAFRHQLNRVSGVAVSETDYLSMLDIGEFVTVGAISLALLGRPHMAARLPAWDVEELRRSAGMRVWTWAVGAHLGNYFVSGWTKIRAGGSDPLFWLMHNPTQTSILIGLERGDNPFAPWPSLVQLSWDAITGAGVLLNLFVLGVQILSPLAFFRRRWLMVFTILFDLFHLAVVATLGAFFFFWIAVNVLIYLSARRVDDQAMTPGVKVTGLVALLTAHFLFYTSHLGWLDGAKLASPSFFAVTREGRQVPVPSVYFGILSYSIAQTAMYIPDDHFPMRLGGNTYNPKEWQDAQSCGPETVHIQDTGVSLATVENMVRETDAAMRQHPAVKNGNLYYLYPHHMVANPLVFAEFNRLSIDDIVGYHYVVDSVCLGLSEGRLVRDVRKRTDYAIDVSP